VLFINAVDEVTRERSMSFLKPEHQQRIADAYHAFADIPGSALAATLDDIRLNDGNLSIPLYVRGRGMREEQGAYAADGLKAAVLAWEESSERLNAALDKLLQRLS
jgi:type I restriction enzyme M protein